MKDKDIITLLAHAAAGLLFLGVAFLLIEHGHEWLAQRLAVSAFAGYLWYSLYMGCKEGRIRPFTQKDNPVGFLWIKCTSLLINILVTIGACYCWVCA